MTSELLKYLQCHAWQIEDNDIAGLLINSAQTSYDKLFPELVSILNPNLPEIFLCEGDVYQAICDRTYWVGYDNTVDSFDRNRVVAFINGCVQSVTGCEPMTPDEAISRLLLFSKQHNKKITR